MNCNTTIHIQSIHTWFILSTFNPSTPGLYCQYVNQSYRLTTDLSATSLLSKTFTLFLIQFKKQQFFQRYRHSDGFFVCLKWLLLCWTVVQQVHLMD